MKFCKRCCFEKSISFFSKKKSSKDGLNPWCKDCNKDYSKKYYIANKESIDEKNNKYYIDNIDKVKDYSKNYKKKNRQYYQEYSALYYKNNKEDLLKYKKKWYLNNREYTIEKGRIYKSENREWYSKYLRNWRMINNKYHKEYLKIWHNENPEKRKEYWEKLRNNRPHIIAWRNTLRLSLNRMGKKKEESTIESLGYSSKDIKSHMESLFKEGMSWENWGDWHIDHIFPVSKFDTGTPISVVNSLDNLQPLWAKDNLSKNNKI
jgi:flagellar biosynthesis GTPase FlhF